MIYAIREYRRLHAVNYARRWAMMRNPLFPSFDTLGGDCTNFISQCIFAGSCIMNATPTFGWYFRASGDYAPAWTGVEYLYNFLISNMESGPIGMEVDLSSGEPGDVIQLGDENGDFYHTLLISAIRDGDIYICAHDNDALDRPLSSYTYAALRCIHITGVRFPIPASDCCFSGLYEGVSLFPGESEALSLSCDPTPPPAPVADIPPGEM